VCLKGGKRGHDRRLIPIAGKPAKQKLITEQIDKRMKHPG
jgi:hypothetical protein